MSREQPVEAVAQPIIAADHRQKPGIAGIERVVGEIGDVVTGVAPGRQSHHEITLFKSLGLAVEDVATADLVYRRALGS